MLKFQLSLETLTALEARVRAEPRFSAAFRAQLASDVASGATAMSMRGFRPTNPALLRVVPVDGEMERQLRLFFIEIELREAEEQRRLAWEAAEAERKRALESEQLVAAAAVPVSAALLASS